MSNREFSSIDKHPLDSFIKPLSNIYFVLCMALAATLFGVFFGIKYDDLVWINRFAAFDIVFGLLLTMSPMFANGIYISQSAAGRYGSRGPDGKTSITTESERKLGNVVAIGVCIAIAGTILNAFGDLLAKIIIGALST